MNANDELLVKRLLDEADLREKLDCTDRFVAVMREAAAALVARTHPPAGGAVSEAMVEDLAKAICKLDDGDWDTLTEEDPIYENQGDYRRKARAALEIALSTPAASGTVSVITDEMVDAVQTYVAQYADLCAKFSTGFVREMLEKAFAVAPTASAGSD